MMTTAFVGNVGAVGCGLIGLPRRYQGYAEVCKAGKYDWCFATDFRDVFFQVRPRG